MATCDAILVNLLPKRLTAFGGVFAPTAAKIQMSIPVEIFKISDFFFHGDARWTARILFKVWRPAMHYSLTYCQNVSPPSAASSRQPLLKFKCLYQSKYSRFRISFLHVDARWTARILCKVWRPAMQY